MAYNFKNLNEVDQQDKPTENTTVMAFESGQPKQIPASEFGRKGFVIDLRSYTPDEVNGGVYTISNMNYDPIYEKITSGGSVVSIVNGSNGDYYINCSTMCLTSTGLVIYIYDNYDGNSFKFVFTNGSYHTTA